MRSTSSSLHRSDGTLCRMCSLQGCEVFFHQCGCRSLAPLLNASEQVTLEPFFVTHKPFQVRILRIGFWHEIQQIEGAGRSSRQVGRDSRDDASRSPRDYKDRILVQLQSWLTVRRGLLLERYGPAKSVLVTDLHCSRILQSFGNKLTGHFRRSGLLLEVHHFD